MGRHTFLTEDVKSRIVAALRAGAYVRDAAAYGGVSERVFHQWCERGRRYDDHLDGGGEITDGEDIYRLFEFETSQARAQARIRMVTVVSKAAQDGDWKAAVAWLERTDPQGWSRVNRVEMTGRDGGPVEVADVTDTERRLSASLNRVLEAATPELVVAEADEDAEVVEDAPVAVAVVVADDDDDDDPYIWPTF